VDRAGRKSLVTRASGVWFYHAGGVSNSVNHWLYSYRMTRTHGEESKYFFGTEKSKTLQQAFCNHQAVCLACKSEDTSTKWIYHEGEKLKRHFCACGAEWTPKEATDQNLSDFAKFIGYDS